jgi:phosphate transport system permease protein
MQKIKRYQPVVRLQRAVDMAVTALGLLILFLSLGLLCMVVLNLVYVGSGRLTWAFLTGFPSRFPDQAGILSAWVGSTLVMICTASIAIPLGVGAAIYLEEYASKRWYSTLIEISIANLAGVPSIIYGLLALSVLIYGAGLGQTMLVAGLTLAMMTFPVITLAAREALRAVPVTLREAAWSIGCDRRQVVWGYVLPQAWPGILTGIIVGLSRAIGEAAPLIAIGTLTYVAFLPSSPLQDTFPFVNGAWLLEPFSALPVQMFNWISRPQAGFQHNAAAAGVVLLALSLLMNLLSILIRYRLRKRPIHG